MNRLDVDEIDCSFTDMAGTEVEYLSAILDSEEIKEEISPEYSLLNNPSINSPNSMGRDKLFFNNECMASRQLTKKRSLSVDNILPELATTSENLKRYSSGNDLYNKIQDESDVKEQLIPCHKTNSPHDIVTVMNNNNNKGMVEIMIEPKKASMDRGGDNSTRFGSQDNGRPRFSSHMCISVLSCLCINPVCGLLAVAFSGKILMKFLVLFSIIYSEYFLSP